jgi:hypothetical protein
MKAPEHARPPEDTIELYVEMEESDICFLETIIKGYDGVAHVCRDWIIKEGKRFVKLLVPPDLVDEVRRILGNISKYIEIGEIRTEL